MCCDAADEDDGSCCGVGSLVGARGRLVALSHTVGAYLGDEEGAGEVDGKCVVEGFVAGHKEWFVCNDAGGVDVDVDGAEIRLYMRECLDDLVAGGYVGAVVLDFDVVGRAKVV